MRWLLLSNCKIQLHHCTMEENVSLINQSSNGTFDFTLEFPHWRLTTSIVLVTRLALSVPLTLLLNASILVTILKTESLRKPINVIHVLLLSANCVVIIPDVTLTSTFIPIVLRYCQCSAASSSIYLLMDMLYFAFQPLNFASLGVFQLLILKGKKHLVTYRAVAISIAVSTIITLLVTSECIGLINSSRAVYVCRDICPQQSPPKFPGTSIAFTIYGVFLYFPSLFTVILCTTWSCIVFKSRDPNEDIQVNKRMISLPIMLPLALFIPTFSLIRAIERILELYTSPVNYPYWAMFVRFLLFQAYEILARIMYPVILLMLNAHIGHPWKEMLLFKKCTTNQVSPAPTTSD